MSIGSGMTLETKLTQQTAEQILASAAVAVVLAEVLGGSPSFSGLVQQVVPVGGPVALGAAVAAMVSPYKDSSKGIMGRYLKRGVIAGAVAAGVAMFAGLLPEELDAQTLSFVGVVAGSVYLGDTLVSQLQ